MPETVKSFSGAESLVEVDSAGDIRVTRTGVSAKHPAYKDADALAELYLLEKDTEDHVRHRIPIKAQTLVLLFRAHRLLGHYRAQRAIYPADRVQEHLIHRAMACAQTLQAALGLPPL